jgi:hypothetical protein
MSLNDPKSLLIGEDRQPLLGQRLMDGSVPVVMSSDQTAMAVSFTPANAITGVSKGTITLGGGSSGLAFAIRSTTYTEPTANAQRSMSSANANDTAAGTGVRTVEIVYFTTTGTGPFSEVITMNGVTPVNTVATDIRFIEKMTALTVGSGGTNAGIITLFGAAGGGGGTVGTIGIGNVIAAVGDKETLWGHHYTAAGFMVEFSASIGGIQAGGAETSGKFYITQAHPLVANSVEIMVDDIILVVGTFERIFNFHTVIEGFVRVTAYAIPLVNNTVITGSFDWAETAI